MIDIEKLKKIGENITSLPWNSYGGPFEPEEHKAIGSIHHTEPIAVIMWEKCCYHPNWRENRDYIVACVNAVPELIAEIEILKEENDYLQRIASGQNFINAVPELIAEIEILKEENDYLQRIASGQNFISEMREEGLISGISEECEDFK
jgi:FtsZ-binding cell division protein ZapB